MSTTDLDLQHDTRTDITVPNREDAAGALAHVLGTGDLYQLSNEQRVSHYLNLCQSMSLNPLSRPFQWIEFKEGENSPAVLTLYFKPSGAAQMLRNHQVSVHYPRKEIVGELFVCEAHGQTPNGRKGVGTKYVPLTNRYGKLSGNRLANAFMSAESGALRRLAMNMFGLSTGPDADELHRVREIVVDGKGQVIEQPTDEQKALAADPRMARVVGETVYEDQAEQWPEGSTAFDGMPDQRVRPDELTPPERPSGPPPSFKHSDEDVTRWRGAWFATVHGLSLDSDAARAAFVAGWTADEWPKAKRCDSLTTMFKRCTKEEASDFLAHVRALMDDERKELLAWADADGNEAGADVGLTPEQAHAEAVLQGDPSVKPPSGKRDRVHDAFVLTGASDDQPEQPAF